MRPIHLTMTFLSAAVLMAIGCQSTDPQADAESAKADDPGFGVTNRMIREKGFDAINVGDWELARDKFAQATRRKPDDWMAQYYLGACEMHLGRPHQAQLALEKALILRPEDPRTTPRILDRLAEAYYRQDRVESLTAFLDETSESYGLSHDYLRQAKYLVKVGDMDAAELAFRKAAYFAQEGDVTPYIAIADFYAAINDAPNTATALRYANYIAPGNPDVAERLRKLGIVPGPTQTLEPPKPAMLQKPWTPPTQPTAAVIKTKK